MLQCPDAATRNARVALLRVVEVALENGLRSLGIATLDEM
ncbi:MAG: DALR anticodon-binding domain-containing protein [Candidatus Eiseniibacteriota bacterium]